VANYSSSEFYAYNNALFTDQPADNTIGLTDEELYDRAKTAGVANSESIQDCITELSFKAWVKDATDRALSEPIPGSNVESLTQTPTIIVNGVKYDGDPADAAAFSAFVVQAAGEAFTENTTPTATPAP
jgi:protein-disulfide isomerase